MKAGARFLVMRYGFLIGRDAGRRIVSVASRWWSLESALNAARHAQRRGVWIVAVGQPAHRRRVTWYPCPCGAEHNTPTCPFGAASSNFPPNTN